MADIKEVLFNSFIVRETLMDIQGDLFTNFIICIDLLGIRNMKLNKINTLNNTPLNDRSRECSYDGLLKLVSYQVSELKPLTIDILRVSCTLLYEYKLEFEDVVSYFNSTSLVKKWCVVEDIEFNNNYTTNSSLIFKRFIDINHFGSV